MTTGRSALVAGASGYVGGRLVPELLAAGWSVKAMTRSKHRLRDASWIHDVDAVEADVADRASLVSALQDVDVAYYLVHSIGGAAASFEDADREGAANFAAAAAECGVHRIVYLGGLQPEGEQLSAHLASRGEVGRILLDGPVPAIVLQAAVVLGSGSASFEMLRYLVERLPAMVVPRWVDTRIQPIAIRDVLRVLVGAASIPDELNRTFDIGGPEVMTYAEMMRAYAAVSGSEAATDASAFPCSPPRCRVTGWGRSPPCRARSLGHWSRACATPSSVANTTSIGTSRRRPAAR